MLRNYFKIAWRNLWKSKMFSLINISGLTIGMTCCLLIHMYVKHELSYDTFHEKSDQIYRLVTDITTPTETINASVTSAPMGPNLKADFPEVLEITRLSMEEMLIEKSGQKFQEDNVMLADASFFEVFSFPLLAGNPVNALKAPFSVVLSESRAKKYFGDENPVGQRLLIEGAYDAMVTGVIADTPNNSHFTFDLLVSMSTRNEFDSSMEESWGNFSWFTYLLLPEGYNPGDLELKMPAFLKKHIGLQMDENKMHYTLFLEPLSDVYLRSKRDSPEKGNHTNVYIFSFIAIFILLIACINFMNLSTARSADRAKEVGTRKMVGAGTRQLIFQFLGESVLLSLWAFALSLLLTVTMMPIFNEVAGKNIAFAWNSSSLFIFLLLAIVVGVLSGLYPAFILARLNPFAVLKTRYGTSGKGLTLQKVLVVLQFAIAVALIGATSIVLTQLNYMRSQDLGFQKEQMLIIDFRNDEAVQSKIEAFKKTIEEVPRVLSVSASGSLPSLGNSSAYTNIETKDGVMQASNLDLYSVDFDFIDQYEIEVLAGRGFSNDYSTDSTQAMVINQAAVKSLGFASLEEALGKRYSQWGREGEIIGVISDFHYRSLSQNIAPLSMRIEPKDFGLLSLNITTDDVPETVNQLRQVWQELAPQRPFEYFFLDETFDEQYTTEVRFGRLFAYFAGLAIFIACLGLLGLVSHSIQKRTKEIGIRKVLGSSIASIIVLLSKNLFKLILVAITIAAPIAYYAMNRWLENFAYRIEVPWWTLAFAAVIVIMVAFLTISFQSVKAALTNPVEALRNE